MTMDKLEIHYYLENNIHSMDAFQKNKAEAELLKILKDVSDTLYLDLSFEIEALEQGGIKEFIKLIKKKKNRRKIVILLAYFGGIISQIIAGVATDKINADNELKNLQKEEIKLRIEKLQKELDDESIDEEEAEKIVNQITINITQTDKIKIYRSNFYKALLEEPKLEKISTTELDENNKPISEERFVTRSQFKDFVIEQFNIEPDIVENAEIEIVSPVFKKGNMKWKGAFNGNYISFNLVDSEFKDSVNNKEVHFTHGTYIVCTLEIEKTIDEEGNQKIKDYNVYDVLNVFEGDYQFITQKAKRIEADKRQLRMDFGDEK